MTSREAGRKAWPVWWSVMYGFGVLFLICALVLNLFIIITVLQSAR